LVEDDEVEVESKRRVPDTRLVNVCGGSAGCAWSVSVDMDNPSEGIQASAAQCGHTGFKYSPSMISRVQASEVTSHSLFIVFVITDRVRALGCPSVRSWR
jgi:hypothetical protein